MSRRSARSPVKEEEEENPQAMMTRVHSEQGTTTCEASTRPGRYRASTGSAMAGPSTQMAQTRATTKSTREMAKLNAEIESLKEYIRGMESSERRLKKQMASRAELLRDTKGERDEARGECAKAEEALEERDMQLEALTREADRYRGWWLTDYYSLKVVLGLVPNKKDVEVIGLAAHARFATYSAALKRQ